MPTYIRSKFSFILLFVFVLSLAVPPFSVTLLGRTPTVFLSEIVMALSALMILGKRRVLDRRVLLHVGGISLLVALSYFWAIDGLRSLAFVKIYIYPFLVLFLGMVSFGTRTDIDSIFEVLLFVFLGWALQSLFNWNLYAIGEQTLTYDFGAKDMLQTSWGRSNTVAAVNILLVPFVFYRLWFSSVFGKIFMISALGVLMVSSLLAMSRGATIAFAVGIVFWLWQTFKLYGKKHLYSWGMTIGLMLVASYVVWHIIPSSFADMFAARWWVLGDSAYIAGDDRVTRWQAILSYLFTHPFGAGLGNYSVVLGSINPLHGESAHNIFLDIMMDASVIAGIIYASLTLFLFKKASQSLRLASSFQDKVMAITQLTIHVIFLLNSLLEPNYFSSIYMTIVSLNSAAIIAFNRHLQPVVPR